LGFHIFILKEQLDHVYFIVMIFYLLYLTPRKNREKQIFKDALIGMFVSCFILTLRFEYATTLAVDYVHLLLTLGIITKAIKLIRNSISNSPEKTQI